MALYMLGALQINTFPIGLTGVSRHAEATIAVKPVIGALEPGEFMGEGVDTLILSGQIVPSKFGGHDDLALAHTMRRRGDPFPVSRGDGARMGSYVIQSIDESHREIQANGVGFVIDLEISMRRFPFDAGGATWTLQKIRERWVF